MTTKRVCLLTGASGTLGTAFCRLLADRYDIAAVSRRPPSGIPTQSSRYVDPLDPAAALVENSNPIYFIEADLLSEGSLGHVVDVALARFGRIDLLVNAAVRYEMGPIMNAYTADYFESQFKWNVILPMRLSVLVAERFWRDRDIENRKNNRNVVNMSSTAGVHLYENAGQGPYAASKAALNHATRHLASEFSTIGIRANALAPESFPGIISTESVVEAIARLDQSVGTGQVVVLDTHGKRTV